MLLCALSHLSGSLFRQTFAAGKDVGTFRLKDHRELPKAKQHINSECCLGGYCLLKRRPEIAIRLGSRLFAGCIFCICGSQDCSCRSMWAKRIEMFIPVTVEGLNQPTSCLAVQRRSCAEKHLIKAMLGGSSCSQYEYNQSKYIYSTKYCMHWNTSDAWKAAVGSIFESYCIICLILLYWFDIKTMVWVDKKRIWS